MSKVLASRCMRISSGRGLQGVCHPMLGHNRMHRTTSETSSKRHFAGWRMMACFKWYLDPLYPHHQQLKCCQSWATAQGEGGTLIFSYIRRLGPFLGFKILNFDIFWVFQKNKCFFGYENFVDIFLGSLQNWTIFRGHFYAF